jgi:hypothetical protein
MADLVPLYVCVGTRARFESWCREILSCKGTERTHRAVGLHIKEDLRKLYGLHGPMQLMNLGDSRPDFLQYVEAIVSQENYVELLRLEAQ